MSTEPFPTLLARVCQRMADALQAEESLLLVYDESAMRFSAAAGCGTRAGQAVGQGLQATETEDPIKAIHGGEPSVFPSAGAAFGTERNPISAAFGDGPVLVVPLYREGLLGLFVMAYDGSGLDNGLLGAAREQGRLAAAEVAQARPDLNHDCFFHRILDADPGGIAVLEGESHVFSYAAPTYRQLLNLESEPIIGRSIRDVLPAPNGERAAALLDDVRATGKAHHAPNLELVDAYGPRHYEVHLLPQVEEDRRIDRIVIMLWPRTETVLVRRALEATILRAAESRSLLSAVLDNTNNGIIFVGEDLTVLYANRQVAEMFGVGQDAILGRNTREVVKAHIMQQMADPSGFADRLLYLYDHPLETAVDEVEVVTPVPRILERYSAPVFKDDGSLYGRIEVYSDVTEVRQLQRNKDAFLSLVSHELRTPVTSIKGYAQLLQRRAKRERTSQHTLAAYETIERQAARMQELIDLLLDLSRLETGRLRLEVHALNLSDLITRVVSMLQMTTDSHTFLVEVPPHPVWIRGDERRLEQVITNLASNAILYSPEGGEIHVRLLEEDGSARVEVEDRGIGIPADALSRVFERFFRAEGVTQSTGMGIGLYITKGIVERHGGTIAVKSTVGRGSTFTITLPGTRAPV